MEGKWVAGWMGATGECECVYVCVGVCVLKVARSEGHAFLLQPLTLHASSLTHKHLSIFVRISH